MKIHVGMMTQNESTDLIPNVASLLPHVDSVNIVDGGSTDGTIPYFRNWQRVEPKIRYFIHPWRDNFPEQRNNYLRRVGEIAVDGDWVLVCDPDEYFSQEAFASLRRLAEVVQKKREHYQAVAFKCRSVSMRGPERTWSNEDDYWKTLYFRWSPSLRYDHNGEGAVHEILRGASPTYCTGHHPEFPALMYEHVKQENVTWPRGCRNLFIGGGGPNLGKKNPRWLELRAISDRLGLKTWHEFQKYLLVGNIDPQLKAWIIENRKTTGFDGASEHREVYKTLYRFYHPEDEPAELRGEYIE